MSGKRLWLMAAAAALLAGSGCGPWCQRWCDRHPPVPAVPVGYAAPPAPCYQPCQPACCVPGTVANAPNFQRQPATGCCP